jgi:hypothetical protein
MAVMAECNDDVHKCFNDGRRTDDEADELGEVFDTTAPVAFEVRGNGL